MPTYRFADGPCRGQTYFQVQRPPVGQVVPCGFHFYEFRADGSYHDVGTVDPREAIGVASLGTHGPRGYADLQRSVNTSLPTGLSHAKVLRRAAHGKLRQRRRSR